MSRVSNGAATAILAVWSLPASRGKQDPRFFYEKQPIPELPYQGFRQDIPNERRGNAGFVKAVFTADGRYLVTLGPGIKVWDAATGVLLQTIQANLDGNDVIAADGKHHLVLAHRADVAPHMPEARGYWIWDFRDGSRRGPVPDGTW